MATHLGPNVASAHAGHKSEITWFSTALILAAFLSATVNGMVVAGSAISVFMDTIATDRAWSHAEVGGAITALMIGMGFGAPIFGMAVNRHGPRRVLLPLTAASAALLASVALSGRSVGLFYGSYFLIGFVNPGAIAHSRLLASWFFRRRGIALTALGAGGFVGQLAMPLVAHRLAGVMGWQNAYLAFGSGEFLIAVPVLYLFFRERRANPGRDGTVITAGGEEVYPDGAPPISLSAALRGRTYWLVVGAQVAGYFAYFGFGTHAVGIMRARGLDFATATIGLSVLAAGGMLGQFITGAVLDRFQSPRVIASFAALGLLSLTALNVAQGAVAVLLLVLLFGIGSGGQTSVLSYFTTRYFGVRNFSVIYGSVLPLLLLASAPAPVLVGAVFDWTGDYNYGLLMLQSALATAVLLFLRLAPYPFPIVTIEQEDGAAVRPRSRDHEADPLGSNH